MDSAVCIPNIGPRQRRHRLVGGVAMLMIAAVLTVALVASGVPRMARVVVFVPLIAGAVGLLQVRSKTCVALAARGLRNMDAGDVPITDADELRIVKAQARRINLQAVLFAVVVTAIILVLGG